MVYVLPRLHVSSHVDAVRGRQAHSISVNYNRAAAPDHLSKHNPAMCHRWED
ncbi:uncharacterized protein B0H18DRAFT_1031895, partial [Fomitopsis serialis]|uniref:uncharacterized protein n=1 Tax=Fomitopsis serialis TaxID=139415 RepID=UPI0020071F35